MLINVLSIVYYHLIKYMKNIRIIMRIINTLVNIQCNYLNISSLIAIMIVI